MILMYHKVDIITPTIWWVKPGDLRRHLENLGPRKFVYLSDYRSPEGEVVVTFDDAYENVYRHALPILADLGIPFEIFVIGARIGEWNDFDPEEPLTRHMGLSDLNEVVKCGGRLQWHTLSHPRLPELDQPALEHEMTVPPDLRDRFPAPHFTWFSYPFGLHDDRAVEFARRRFEGAVSVTQGSSRERWRLNRITVDRNTAISPRDIAEVLRLPLDKIDVLASLTGSAAGQVRATDPPAETTSSAQVAQTGPTETLVSHVTPFWVRYRRRAGHRTGTRLDEMTLTCGVQNSSGIDEPADWNDWTERETTADQQRIEEALENIGVEGSSLLHIGIGNSSLARRFHESAALIDGITIREAEVRRARELRLSRYTAVVGNKYSAWLTRQLEHRYDFIVDNNPTTFCCCRAHLSTLLANYCVLLKPHGVLLTDRAGLKWTTQPNDPRWGVSEEEWRMLGRLQGLRVVRFTDSVLGLEKAGRLRTALHLIKVLPRAVRL